MRKGFAAALAAGVAISACSPAADDSPRNDGREAAAAPPASPNLAEAADLSQKEVAAAAANSAPASRESAAARRCGWLVNPTPANWWLTDRDGQWILGTQGADQAPGMDEMPDMSTAGWVETNGHYGYGCACMTITADADGRVTRVADAQPKPLKQCRADKGLPRP